MTANPTTMQDPSANGDWPRHVLLCRDKLAGPGGAERVFLEQAAALIERGIRCTLVLFELADSMRDRVPPEAHLLILDDHRHSDLLFFPKLLRLSRLLRKLRPDCVIAHQSLGDYLRWALLGTRIPYFLIKWNSIFYQAHNTSKYSFLYRRCFDRVRQSFPAYIEGVPARWRAGPLKRLLNELYALRDWLGVHGARKVFSMSSQSQWENQQLYGVTPTIWAPGSRQGSRRVPRDEAVIRSLRQRYGVQDGQAVVLSVNRLEYRKRVETVVEGFILLSAQGVDAKLVIVGDGEQRKGLERRVSEAGLANAVVFTGRISEEMLAHHYHMCDVAVAIIWGSWALAVVEPLVYSKKTLISNEIPDLLEGVPNLFRVEPEPSAVARGFEEALSAVTENSYDVLKDQLNWDGQMDKLLEHMRAAVAR